ncbi:MAG: cytochrome D ubiquinol oxidase subunit II, partial [Nitrospinaceae bacterium]
MNQNNYCTHDPEIDRLIDELAEKCAPGECREMLRQILTTTAKLGREHGDLGDFKLINTSLKELRHAVRIFVPYRTVRKAIIFGSARTEAQEPAYDLAQEVARALVEKKFMVISGAGGGIMAAANLGAGRENSFGINIKLPFEQKSNRYIEGDK